MTKSRSKISRQAVKRSAGGKARAQSRKQSRPAHPSAKTAPAKTPAKGQWVYAFGGGKAEGRVDMLTFGGKGVGLFAEMAHLGLPVPPGFTITTAVCTYFYQHGKTYPKDLKPQVEAALAEIGRITGKTFGDGESPLLVSVRSGARASMPGMLDTVLNLGLNDATVAALARKSGDRRFAYDSYRRFITMYADVVLGLGHDHFEEILDEHKDRNGYALDTDLDADDWQELVGRFKERVEEEQWRAVSAGPAGAAMGRRRRRVRLVDEPARDHLSPPAQHPGKLGHGGQRAGHGVRQYGPGPPPPALHLRAIPRRARRSLRRIPHQRAGRGRGRRHPHAAGDHRRGAQGGGLRQGVDGGGAAAGLRRTQAHPRRAGKTLPRHAGPRIHRRAGQALDATDAQRQAHHQGGAAHRGGAGAGAADQQDRGGNAHRSRRPRPAAASDHRSRRRAQHHRHRPAGRPLPGARLVARSCSLEEAELLKYRVTTSSWSGSRLRPRTSTACTPPEES